MAFLDIARKKAEEDKKKDVFFTGTTVNLSNTKNTASNKKTSETTSSAKSKSTKTTSNTLSNNSSTKKISTYPILKGNLPPNKGKTPILDAAFKAAAEERKSRTTNRSAPKSSYKGNTQSPKDYSSTVKYLEAKGVRGASGIMTENEWRRRKGTSANTYQDYLDGVINKYGKGNIDLTDRPIYKNPDGTISTVASHIIGADNKYFVLPSIVRDKNGNVKKFQTSDDVYNHFKNTGEYLGIFDTQEEAVEYAQNLYIEQQAYYLNNKKSSANSYKDVKEIVELIKKIEDAKARTTDDYFNKRREEEIARLKNVPQADNIAYWETEDAKKEVKELTKQLNRYIDGAREANFYDSTIGAFKRSYYNMKYGKEAYGKKQGLENEADKYKELLASDEFNTYTDNKALQTLQFIGDWLGQQLHIASDPRTAASVAAAGTMAGVAGQLVPFPEEVLTVPGAMYTGYKAGAALNTYETSAGHTYETLKSLGVSDEVASIAADGVGFGVGMLEAIQLDELVDAYVLGATNGASDNVLKIIGAEILKRAKNTTFETTEEVLQEIVTIAGEDVAYKVDKGEHLYTTDEIKERLGETAETSFMGFGAMNVPAVAFNTTRAVRSNYIEEKIANLGKESRNEVQYQIEKGLKQTEGTTAQKLATELKDKEYISDKELGNLVLANELALKETMELDFARDPELLKSLINEAKEVGGESKNLANKVEKKLNTGNEVSVEDVKKLITANEVYIANENKTENTTNNTTALESQVREKTGYGNYGVREFSNLLGNSEDGNFDLLYKNFNTAYEIGLKNPDYNAESITNDIVQRTAFNAGKLDYLDKVKNKQIQAKNNVVWGKESGFNSNNAPSDVKKWEIEATDAIAKMLQVKAGWAEQLKGNAEIENNQGIVTFNKNFERYIGEGNYRRKVGLVYHAAHEMGIHRVIELAPKEGMAFVKELYSYMTDGMPTNISTPIQRQRASYKTQDVELDAISAMEELSAYNILELYNNNEQKYAEAMRKIAEGNNQDAKTGMQKFLQIINDIIDSLMEIWNKLTGKEKAEMKSDIDELTRLRDMYEDAVRAAAKNAKVIEAKNEKNSANSKNSLENKTEKGYNEDKSYALKNGSELKTKIKYSPTGIKLSKNEYAKFHQSTSTDYYMSYKTHEGLQYQSCVSDDTHILYIYEDGGFGNYNVVAKIDFANEDIINAITEEVRNGTTYRITDLVNRLLQTFEVGRSGYTVYNTRTGKRSSSRGDGIIHKRQSKSDTRGTNGSSSGLSENKRRAADGGNTDGNLNEGKSYSLKNSTSENISHSLYTDEVIFSSRYNAISRSQNVTELYDNAKKGNVESAYELISQLLTENDINKIKSFGNDVYLMPIVGLEGTSTNVLPSTIAEHISVETEQNIFNGIYKENSSNSRAKTIWGRMKENYPSFTFDGKETIKTSDIAGRKFVLIDDNSTTGRTFVGLKNFLEENGGEVVGYYALTTGQDQSEKMVTTDETWNKIVSLGIDAVRDFAEKEGVKREISKRGLTERESQVLVRQFEREKGNTRRGNEDVTRSSRSGRKVQAIYDTEKKTGSTGKGNEVNFSLKGIKTVALKDLRNLVGVVEDLQNGKRGTSERLAKYIDKGIITTEEYDELVKTYGAIPSGENPHREIQVPQRTAKDKKVSQTVRTILEAKATPDEAVPTIEKMVEDGIFSYDVYTDKQALDEANSNIKKYGWDESVDDWFKDVEKGIVSKQHTAMGWALYNNAANIAATTTSETERTSAIKTSLKILDAMVRHQRSAAQALQATRILKKLSPETQLYAAQKSVQAFQKELSDRYGDKAPNLEIDERLAEQFLNAKTPEERAEIETEIHKDIGRQMPSRFVDKWNAWRYLAMLGNVRTHIRNIGGNAFFAPVVFVKDLGATAIESIVYHVSGKKTARSKALVISKKSGRTLLKAAWDDYSTVADLISNGGKYSDFAMANQRIEDGRQIFKFKPLELARKGNSALLEKEDMWFARPHYAYALAQYCKANNITAEQIKRGKAIAPARDYAIKEAQKATYRDTNAFSQFVSELGRKNNNDNIVKKASSTVIEGISPFRKTPANILVRGVEYSPLGLLKGLSYDLYQVSKGKMSSTEAIDNISAGLTGTVLLGLGVFLAAQGLIRGHGEDEEEEKEFKELMGHQSYALELPNGQSITLDWLAPESLPFFVGVNIWETTKGSDEELTLSTILNSIRNITEPMLEMSCLQGLNDLFEGIGYAKSNDTSGLVAVISSAVKSYLMQGLPTMLGQAERTGEEHRMTTYTEKDDFLTGDMQYTLGKASAKIPFWDYHQIPYIDAWGRKEASGVALKRGLNNFLNPAYTSTVETSKMEKELLRLYESTGEASVFPSRADKYFTVDKKRKDLTADEYVRYATLKGKKSYKLITDLVQSDTYKLLDDGEKVKAVEEAYDYANQKAKEAISNYKPDTWVSKADEFSDVGSYITFRTEVSATKKENGDKISRQEVADIILDMAQNDSDMWNMYLSMYDSKGDKYAYDSGVSGEAYMYFLETLNEVDAPNKSGKYGTYTQAEAKEAVNQLEGLSREEQRALWQSVNTTWKRNPF